MLQSEAIAISKGIKSRAKATQSAQHHAASKPDLFNGMSRTFEAKNDDFDEIPPETKNVQLTADQAFANISGAISELFDITATVDFGNTKARADVEVDGQVLVKDAPVPYLLFLEKEIGDLYTFVSKMPVLDPAARWDRDANTKLYFSKEVRRAATKKVTKPLLLAPATEHHPAQTDKIVEDVVVGHWTEQKISGALTEDRKSELLKRIEKLQYAVKQARERGNSVTVEKMDVGKAFIDYILA